LKLLDKYGNVEIFNRKGEVPLYKELTPPLNDLEYAVKEQAKETAIKEIDSDSNKIIDPQKVKELFLKEIRKIVHSNFPRLSKEQVNRISWKVVLEMVGYGALDPLLGDEKLEEVMVLGKEFPVFVYHKKYGHCETNIKFKEASELNYLAEKIARDVNKRVDRSAPLLDARLPDGSRVNIAIPPISLDGVSITIRKFRKDPISIVDLINYGTINAELAAFLWICVDGLGFKPCNILIAGGTASGKTSTLNTLLGFILKSARIVTIEDTAELCLYHQNKVRLETIPPNVEGKGEVVMDDLLKNSLRMRPDRIMVGEVRGPEARTLFTAMNTGHDGCMSTIHANSIPDVITRLTNAPMNVPISMIPSLDLIVMEERFFDEKKGIIRRITEVAELFVDEGGEILENSIYKWNPVLDEIKGTSIPKKTQMRLEQATERLGIDFETEFRSRQEFLEKLVSEGITRFDDIYSKIGEYITEHQMSS